MALIVENGSGLADAESYVSIAQADAYFSSMGNTDWTGDDAAKEAALRNATQYLEVNYVYRGTRHAATQALSFPRDGICIDGVYQTWPITRLNVASYELAVRALSGSLTQDVEDAPVTEETVGPITTKYGSSTNGGQVRFSAVDRQLSALVESGSGSYGVRIVRS